MKTTNDNAHARRLSVRKAGGGLAIRFAVPASAPVFVPPSPLFTIRVTGKNIAPRISTDGDDTIVTLHYIDLKHDGKPVVLDRNGTFSWRFRDTDNIAARLVKCLQSGRAIASINVRRDIGGKTFATATYRPGIDLRGAGLHGELADLGF